MLSGASVAVRSFGLLLFAGNCFRGGVAHVHFNSAVSFVVPLHVYAHIFAGVAIIGDFVGGLEGIDHMLCPGFIVVAHKEVINYECKLRAVGRVCV